LIVAAASVLVVALGGLSVWFFTRPDAPATIRYQPAEDFLAEPEFGPDTTAESLFDGDFDSVYLTTFSPSGNLIAAVAQSTGKPASPSEAAAVTAIFADGCEPAWKEPVDLAVASGFDQPEVNDLKFTDSDYMIVNVGNGEDAGEESLLVAMDSRGAVLGTTTAYGEWSTVGDHVVVRTEDGQLSVRSAQDVDSELWHAKAPDSSYTVNPGNSPDPESWLGRLMGKGGAYYIEAKDGYRELRTGEKASLGKPDEDTQYLSTLEGVILRATQDPDGEDCQVMRVDPATGKDLWNAAIKSETFGVWDSNAKAFLLETVEEGEVSAIDAATGEELWAHVIGDEYPSYAKLLADARAIMFAQSPGDGGWAAMLVGQDGTEASRFEIGTPTSLVYGTAVLYTVSDGTLIAYDLQGEGAELWTLDLDEDDAAWSLGGNLLVGNAEHMRQLVGS
jgi:outer membrane protein assembly factor BamB